MKKNKTLGTKILKNTPQEYIKKKINAFLF